RHSGRWVRFASFRKTSVAALCLLGRSGGSAQCNDSCRWVVTGGWVCFADFDSWDLVEWVLGSFRRFRFGVSSSLESGILESGISPWRPPSPHQTSHVAADQPEVPQRAA